MAITTNGVVGAGLALTQLAPGTSADLAGRISDESGTGVFALTISPTFTTPALGTPSAVTLTNGTGLPVSGITASTSAALGVGTIELGHATDTTISRASAGVVAIEGVNVVTETATQTLSNKTLTAPKFADSGFIADANGNELISFPATVASAVNQVVIENAATGDGATTGQPIIRAQGNDTNISLNLVPKGSGVVQANGVAVVTTSGTQTLTNKTLTSPVISGLYISDGSIIIEGATADSFETTLQFTDPTADRTITFPDGGGTIAFSTSVDATISTLSSLEIAVIMAAF